MNTLILRRLSGMRQLNRFITLNVKAVNAYSTKSGDGDQIEDKIKQNEANYYDDIKENYKQYKERRVNEPIERKRSRLVYQSSKRGTSENGILMIQFAAKYLPNMNETELDEYDKIINNLYNEWDLYYWMTNAVPIPVELQNNSVMHKLKDFCTSYGKEFQSNNLFQ